MKIEELSLKPTSGVAADYIQNTNNMDALFDYPSFDSYSFEERAAEIKGREFQRERLYSYLWDYHHRFPISEKIKTNIEKLKQPEAVAVVGGQQAGLLTGPLFTIHKCISIIKLAKEQEERLQIPVVPIFWIAGEDHDYDEINHVFTKVNGRTKKNSFPSSYERRPLSQHEVDHEQLKQWTRDVVRQMGETKHTGELLRLFEDLIDQSASLTDFFANVLITLFKEEGLVLLDSGDTRLRELESEFFQRLVKSNEELDHAFTAGIEQIDAHGYPIPIERQKHNAHLFYHHNDERILLFRDEEGRFRGKNNESTLSAEELLDIAKEQPHLLSNNVVTRPLMQEHLLPTLAFIAGSGEIAYWGVLKPVFHHFGFSIPPIVPRLSLTIIDKKIEKIIGEKNLSVAAILDRGIEEDKERWYQKQKKWNVQDATMDAKAKIEEFHQDLRYLAVDIDKGLDALARKNRTILLSQIEFLEKKMEQSIRAKYEHELRKFDEIELELLPNGIPQERVWNILYYLNHFGPTFVDDLLEGEYKINGKHKLIYY
jgi:bacillithiol biosynthesis cysteine-adding enzyme BshC